MQYDQLDHKDLLLLLTIQPLPRNGGMVKDHGAPEAGQLPRTWTRGHRETERCQRVSSAKSPYLDSAQKDERCPGQVSAGAA